MLGTGLSASCRDIQKQLQLHCMHIVAPFFDVVKGRPFGVLAVLIHVGHTALHAVRELQT